MKGYENLKDKTICIVGLGYVGLPLAIEFAIKGFHVVGYDVNQKRIEELDQCVDSTREVTADQFGEALDNGELYFTPNYEELCAGDIFIITVPTPVDENNSPDLEMVIEATATVAEFGLKEGGIVIYESTVYPGATEEVCLPILEEMARLKCNEEFWLGYSPERINPGDKVHTLKNIVKVTSGSSFDSAEVINELYNCIVDETHMAPSIKVAEASKVIENTQRDINIAFVNELAMIFNRLGIDTQDVLDAAGTKWNFLKFKPGLVGGHCIGVDPFYLSTKAESVGYHAQLITAGRRINDGMSTYIVNQIIKGMISKGINVKGSTVVVMGITFKENCPDIRNSKVVDVVKELEEFGINVRVIDPYADKEEVKEVYGIELETIQSGDKIDALVYAVDHDRFRATKEFDISKPKFVYDIKSVISKNFSDSRL